MACEEAGDITGDQGHAYLQAGEVHHGCTLKNDDGFPSSIKSRSLALFGQFEVAGLG